MSDETKWDKYAIEEKVLEILAAEPDAGHHMGRGFMTAYQIAIEFARRYPEVVEGLGYKIGGRGTGEHYSLSTYLARMLSGKIDSNQLEQVEGGFLSNQHLTDIVFSGDIHSSLTGTQFTLSMFRLRKSR